MFSTPVLRVVVLEIEAVESQGSPVVIRNGPNMPFTQSPIIRRDGRTWFCKTFPAKPITTLRRTAPHPSRQVFRDIDQ
jgi:hypothetical protein